ncbi:MAG TPA: glycosyltransferase [Chloroflexota bacterium]|jgi:glycosyltransferase involved in cell wall biosynthesis|nr:glycosyltransferase [Chloroflexota bacterium]
MRVGLIVPGYSANAADWCIPALRHLAGELARTEDVRVIAVRYPYATARYQVDGVDVLALGGAARRGLGSVGVVRATLAAVAAEHRRRRFDVLHAFWATESGFLTALAGRLLGVPTVVSLAGGELVHLPDIGYGDQRRGWERLKIRTGLRLADTVTAGSAYLLRLATRHMPPVGTGKLRWAPLGVPLDMFSASRAEVGVESRVLHVGTLTAVKDQALLLRAFGLARQEHRALRLEIVGDGPLRGRLEALSRSLGLADSVCFRGDVNHAALPALYGGGGVFVLSSRHEAQSMVAVEAAACGLPIVGTNVGVVPELCRSPVGVAPVGDAAALAQALLAVSAETSAAATYAHERAQADFGVAVCAARFKALYAAM